MTRGFRVAGQSRPGDPSGSILHDLDPISQSRTESSASRRRGTPRAPAHPRPNTRKRQMAHLAFSLLSSGIELLTSSMPCTSQGFTAFPGMSRRPRPKRSREIDPKTPGNCCSSCGSRPELTSVGSPGRRRVSVAGNAPVVALPVRFTQLFASELADR